MPIWLRNLTHNYIADQKQKESEAYNKSYSDKNNKKIDLNKPEEAKQSYNKINVPSYVTKASKK